MGLKTGVKTLYSDSSRVAMIKEVTQFWGVDADGLLKLPPLPTIGYDHLTRHTIDYDNNIQAAGCKHLKELRQLAILTIGVDNNIQAEGCEHLKELKQLASPTMSAPVTKRERDRLLSSRVVRKRLIR